MIIERRKMIVVRIRFFKNIFFNCLKGPLKNIDLKLLQITYYPPNAKIVPMLYTTADLPRLPESADSKIPNESKLTMKPKDYSWYHYLRLCKLRIQ